MQIETSPTVYFKDMIDTAIKHQRIKTDVMVEFYLVNLLTDFVNAEKIKRFNNEPLAITMYNALNSGLNEQRVLFKEIGDIALYTSGFFSDSFNRKIIDIDYYIAMGSAAYNYLANLMRGARTSFYNLYSELAVKFKAFVDVLTEVSERCLLTSKKDMLRIYERWLRLKTKRSEALLKGLGIEPLHDLNYKIIH